MRCNFSMMVSQDVAEFEGIAQKQNRNFVTDIPEKPLYANIVIEDMREVLDNILMNAIKYSKPETDILVSMEEEESTIHIIVSNVSEEVKEADCTRILISFTGQTMQEVLILPATGWGCRLCVKRWNAAKERSGQSMHRGISACISVCRKRKR